MSSSASKALKERAPYVALRDLDHLWFQISGTLCNLRCHHCFISCSPENDSFQMLNLETIEPFLQESVELGVKEYYFTGGEPFLNPQMLPILRRTLQLGPATVLTNATILPGRMVQELRTIEKESRYSLEIRVSLDGPNPVMNDPIRGEGTFALALRGLRNLVEVGFLPIITIMQSWLPQDENKILKDFVNLLRSIGYNRPRLKVIPALKIGAESMRTQGYTKDERVTAEMMEGFDQGTLYCSHTRMVTDKGVYVCPILIDSPAARLGQTLQDSLKPYAIRQPACYTCYLSGSICSNVSSGNQEMDGW